MDPTPSDLARIRELYAQGRYRQALTAAEKIAPLRTWQGTPARLLAGRIAMQVGAPCLGRRLHAAAFRSTPSNLEAVYYHARYRFERFGPFSCLRFIAQNNDWSDASPELRADWLGLRAFVASRLRDVDRAEKYLAQAQKLAPARAWLQVEQAAVYEAIERHDEALLAANRALELQPWFRPGVQAKAHLLHRVGRIAEAMELLREASDRLESSVIVAQLATLQLETDDYAAARRSLDRYEELSPLLEDEGRKWLRARRADIAYFLGETAAAQAQAEAVGDEFYDQFSLSLASGNRPRHRIPFDLSYSGSSPSVHDLLCRHWGESPLPASSANPPLDGLPDAGERRRFETAGWHCMEFSLSMPAAEALLSAGLPFLITIVEVGVSQSRICVGMDSHRQTLLLADGVERAPAEAPVDLILQRYAASGPRCLLAVPPAAVNRIPAFQFPEQAEYDRLFKLQMRLADRDFSEAKNLLDEFRRTAPKSRLTKCAAIAWARGTFHPVLLLEAVSALQADYPQDGTLTLSRAAALRDLGRVDERRELFLSAGAANADAEPLLQQSLAQMLLIDCDQQETADWLLRRSLRSRPLAAAGYYLLASQRWERQDFSEAIELYRLAACLDEREEQFADAYFRVARVRGQAPEALRLFQQRATRTESPLPSAVRALFNALIDRDEVEPAFTMLDKAIEKLPLESATGELTPAVELRLFRAEKLAQHGRHDTAWEEIQALRQTAPSGDWHRAAARIAGLRPDPATALTHIEAALEIDPLWIDGQRTRLQLIQEIRGLAAAKEHAAAVARRFPHCYPLMRLRAEYLTPHLDDDAAILATRNLLDLCPADAWAWRQLALALADRGHDAEARTAIERAGAIEPHHPSYHAVKAHVHRRSDRIDAALEAYREAIRLNVDHDLAVTELVHLSRGRAEKKEALRFIAGQLHRQRHTGEGLISFRDQWLSLAAADADADDNSDIIEELQNELERILDERPDLWQAWSLQIQQLGLLQRYEEAATLAREATERFPLIAQLWIDLARVQLAQRQHEERIESLQQAVAAIPGWSPAAMELADALEENGDHREGLAVLRRAVARSPMDATAHIALADRLWSAGASEEALQAATRAIRIDPGFDAAWRMVAHWGDRLDRPDEAVKLARELTRTRPGDSRGWLRLARLLAEPQHNAETLAALENVIRLEPANVEAHDLKAERLAEMGQFDQALAAALPTVLQSEMPLVLQGRAAWVEAKRGNYSAAIPPMQKLVAVEPEYFWGWQQLAEWYNETGRHENFLEASAEMVRLKPEHPLPLTMRGEAKLKTGDRSGGKEDLRDALRIAPQYAPAALILFDACLDDNEFHDARKALAVLQEHAVGPEVTTKQVKYCCRTGDAEGALRGLSEIAELPGDHSPMALQVAMSEIAAAGWEQRASRVLKEAWQSGGSYNPWAAVQWLDTPEGESAPYEERLEAVDAAIEAYPTFAAAHDRKAEMLALVGKFDEAQAACRPQAFAGQIPITLRGRAAWIEARRGRRAQAITLMVAAVTHDPSYLWGWRNLAEWYDADGRHRDFHDAADHMVRLAPDALAYCYRGEARKTLGDRRGAREDFQTAFDLDPTFDAAGLQLITEHLHAGDAQAAAATLAKLQSRSDHSLVRLRGVQVAAALGDLELASKRLQSLMVESGLPLGFLAEAISAFDDAGWIAEADDELDRAMSGANVTAATAALWAGRHLRAERGQQVLDALPKILEKNIAAGREAVLTYALLQAKPGRGDAAATAIHRFADVLRTDDAAWAAAGAALSISGMHALAVNWLSDWKTRAGVEPAMLRPLAASLRALDRDHDALAVCREAIDLGGEPPVDFLGWLALAAATDGRTTDAAQTLAEIDRIGLPDGTRLLVALAEALVMVQHAGPDAKAAAFAEAREHLRTAAGSCDIADQPLGLARWYRRVVTRLAMDSGLITAKIWAFWQKFRPWIRDEAQHHP